MSRLFIISSVAIAVIGLLARGMTISYVLPSRKYDMAHINLNSPRKQSLSVDIGKLLPGLGMGNCNTCRIPARLLTHATCTHVYYPCTIIYRVDYKIIHGAASSWFPNLKKLYRTVNPTQSLLAQT